MKKQDAIDRWRQLPDNASVLQAMVPIPYKATGSRYGACGIRIDGTPAFIDAVLGRLKDLLDGENHVTRLELARSEVKPVEIHGRRTTFANAARGAEVCYVRLHVRGREGAIASSVLDRHLDGATERFARTRGSE